jgi:GDP-L-fucose synthase
MPTNLYGPGDNFHPENSHVWPAFLRRFHEAARDGRNEVVISGSGVPMREFLHLDDMASASLFVLDLPKAIYDANTLPMLCHINVGTSHEISIVDLATLAARVTEFERPNYTGRK